MDFFHHDAPPLFLSHLVSAYCMYYALGVFAAVYEYTCPFTPLSRRCFSPPLPPLPFLLSLFSTCLPSWQTGKQTASLGPVLFLAVASSHSSQHGHTHTQTNTNMLTPVQHHILRGEYCWHKYEPPRVILYGMTQVVSLRCTSLLVRARQPETYTHKETEILFIFMSS